MTEKKTITVHNYDVTLAGKKDSLTGLPVMVTTEWGESEVDAYAHMPDYITEVHPFATLSFEKIATAERAIETRTAEEIEAAARRDDEAETRQLQRIKKTQASLVYQGDIDDPKAGTEDECCG